MCFKINFKFLRIIFIIFLLSRHIINIIIKTSFFKKYAIEKINAFKKISESVEENNKSTKILSYFNLENFKANDLVITFLSLKNISFQFNNINICYSGFNDKKCFNKTIFNYNISIDYCPINIQFCNSSILFDNENQKTFLENIINKSEDVAIKDLIFAYLKIIFERIISEFYKKIGEYFLKHVYLFFAIEMYANIYNKIIQFFNFEIIFGKICKKVKTILINLISKINNYLSKNE